MKGQATIPRHPPVSLIDLDRQGDHAHSQVDEKLVDRPPRYWTRASREPAMLAIKNGRRPQLDNTFSGSAVICFDRLASVGSAAERAPSGRW